MVLNVLDRVVLLQVLPIEGDIATLRIVRDLRKELSFSEGDLEEIHLRVEEDQIKWEGELNKDVPIGKRAMAIIEDRLVRLSKEKVLKEGHLPVYEKFFPAEDEV